MTKFHFNESQKATLKGWFYQKGITSVAKKNASVIAKKASDLRVQDNQVKLT